VPTELTETADPAELVPGDPEAIWELAHTFGRMGVTLEDVGLGFRSIDDGGWRGPAADAFHAHFDHQPRRFLTAADAFVTAAVALDTYACALSWARRQAGEALALAAAAREGRANPARPELTPRQQAEQTGVVAYVDDAAMPARESMTTLRDAAVDAWDRARGQLRTVTRETVDKLRAATALAPRPLELWDTIRPAGPPRTVARVDLPAPVVPPERRLDHDTLRDNPDRWSAGIVGIRRRLRRLGLDQLSPRLKQHLFAGHYQPRSNRNLGYHHRFGGVDRGPVRVVNIVQGPFSNGVYQAEIVGPNSSTADKIKISTFFPDSWTENEVLCAIRHAFTNRYEYNRRKRRWRGVYEGMHIQGFVEGNIFDTRMGPAEPRLYQIKTAYPMLPRRGGS